MFQFCAATKPSIAQLLILKTAKGNKLEIIKSMTPRWQPLGYLMNFDAHETVELIAAEHQSKFVCCQEIFKRWLKSPDATWENLVELLRDCEHTLLAEQIKDALGLWMVLFCDWYYFVTCPTHSIAVNLRC